jgi:hypothetical protein
VQVYYRYGREERPGQELSEVRPRHWETQECWCQVYAVKLAIEGSEA